MNRQPPRWQFQTISLNSRNLSGLRHKYDDVRCTQFGLWRGAKRAHPRPGAVTDEQRSHRPNSAQPGGRQLFFAQTSLLAPHRSTAGYARHSRLVWAKNLLPRTSSYLCLRPLSLRGIERATCGPFVPLRGCDFLELLSSLFLKPTQKRL